MSKIICEICGTVYPDTAEACPICGYPRENSKAVADDDTVTGTAAAAVSGTTTRVKGGRFSNKNVKKRLQASAAGKEAPGNREPEPDRPEASRGLIITVILLVIGILLVGAYIGWRFWKGRDAYDNPKTPSTQSTTLPTDPSETAQTGIPCTDLTISESSITFSEAGRTWVLTVNRFPADTTDELVLISSNEDVVTVSADGVLTAVGPGTATVTVTCGEISRVCVVTCAFAEETTEPVETTQPEETTEPEETTKPTEPAKDGLKLSHTDVTLFAEGENFRITVKYNGETVSPAVIQWSSKDETVATVENGKVVAVGGGVTTITVSYNGETAKCVVRCSIETEETEETEPTGEPDETEETEPAESGWQISHTDVTLRVGESFRLRIFNEAGETADVVWSVSESGIVSVDGNKITGEADGRVKLTATVDGQTFTCIVRVKA